MSDHKTTIFICPRCHQTFRTANTVFGICPNCNVATVYDPVCEERDRYRATLEEIKAKGCLARALAVTKRPCSKIWPDEPEIWCPSCMAAKALKEGARV